MNAGELQRDLKRLGWSAENLAKRTGIPARTIYRILSGEVKKPHVSTVKDIELAIKNASAELAESTLTPLDPSEVVRWFSRLPETTRATVLMQILVAAGEDLRTRALDAARNVEQMMGGMKRAGGVPPRGTGQDSAR